MTTQQTCKAKDPATCKFHGSGKVYKNDGEYLQYLETVDRVLINPRTLDGLKAAMEPQFLEIQPSFSPPAGTQFEATFLNLPPMGSNPNPSFDKRYIEVALITTRKSIFGKNKKTVLANRSIELAEVTKRVKNGVKLQRIVDVLAGYTLVASDLEKS
jgi:hypothetical protein